MLILFFSVCIYSIRGCELYCAFGKNTSSEIRVILKKQKQQKKFDTRPILYILYMILTQSGLFSPTNNHNLKIADLKAQSLSSSSSLPCLFIYCLCPQKTAQPC